MSCWILLLSAALFLGVALTTAAPLTRDVGPVPPCAIALRRHWRCVRMEADAVRGRSHAARGMADWGSNLKDFFARTGAQAGWTAAWAHDGSWDNFGLNHEGGTLDGAAERCPATCALLEATPGVCIAGFSRVGAGGRIQPHTDGEAGFSSGRIAVHLCLSGWSWLRVGRTWYLQYPGRLLAFDPEARHEVVNRSGRARTLLYLNLDRSQV